jgi:hypothetical protein
VGKANLLSTNTVTFQELIGNGRRFRVPAFQRDYSWEKEQWEDLWDDLVGLLGEKDARHYMGAIVVEGGSDREFVVIDGQQRMATLSILALAVIGSLALLAERGVDPEANRERARELRSRFIGERDPASLVETSRLILNSTDDAFYQDYMVQLREPRNPRSLPRSSRLLWDCFRFFRSSIDEKMPSDDGEAMTRLVSEAAARQLLFIQITVDDEMSAYTVFETLNARGIELSTTDLLKNYLFSRVKVGADLDNLQRRWCSMILTVGQERFPEFLRYHVMCRQPKVRKERLFRIVREDAKEPEEVFGLMEALEGRGELFSALMDPTHGYWAERADCRAHVRELNLFRVRQMVPLLFAAWETMQADFGRVLKLVVAISFRYNVVGGLNPNDLEAAYHGAAKAVLEGAARSPADVFQALKGIWVDDDKFRQDFALWAADAAGQRRKLVKYVLARLEADASRRDCDPDTDSGTVEHVLPENPAEAWGEMFPREHWDSHVYRLGNLALLEPSLNRAVGNAGYAEKRKAYADSRYQLTRRIAEMAPEEWTPEFLEKRQRDLADRAVHLWRSDFASG